MKDIEIFQQGATLAVSNHHVLIEFTSPLKSIPLLA